MKVKNLMFSGFAAAMFAGVIGGADAATYNLASKDYVDTKITDVDAAIEKKQDKLTAGTGVTIDTVDGVTTIGTKPVQIGEQDVSVADAITNVTNEITNITNVLGEIPDNTTVQAELDKKVDKTTYNAFVAEQAQRDKNQDDAIALIEGGEGGTGGITDLVTRVSAAEGEIDTLQEDIAKKEDVANKVVSADELTDMQADVKATKYTSVAAAEAIAQSVAATATGTVANRVDTLESTVGNDEAGLVKDVNTLETTVGNEESGLVKDVDTLEKSVQTLQDANYINTDGKSLGGYIIKANGQGGYELLDVAIVDGTGQKDLITDTDLVTVTE